MPSFDGVAAVFCSAGGGNMANQLAAALTRAKIAAAFIGVFLSFFLAGTATAASPGCDAVNSIWGGGVSLTNGATLENPWPLPSFAVGERIVFRATTTGTTSPSGGGFALYENGGGNILVEQY